jgi:hypothetical protein
MSSVRQYCLDAEIAEILIDENNPTRDFDEYFQEQLLSLENRIFQNG